MSKFSRRFPLVFACITLLGFLVSEAPVAAATNQCPEDLEALLPLMLDDLPGYANRVIQRARSRDRTGDISGYILLSSEPNLNPLPLDPAGPLPGVDDAVQQVFFTTLERQYGVSGFEQLQAHHWAFFVPTNLGWQLTYMQTSLESYPGQGPAAPPRESTHGVIAQAIDLWLRDCQAGVLSFPEE